MTLFLIFLKSELAKSGKNFSLLVQNILFFLLTCFLFFFLSSKSAPASQIEAINIIYFCLLFSLFFSNSDFLKTDFKDGTVEQMIIYSENFEVFVFAKIIANFILFCLPILLVSPVILKSLNLAFGIEFVLISFFASLAINFICAFCGCLNIAGSKMSLIAILIIPLIVPVLLIANVGIIDDNFSKAVKILAAISIFFGAISTFAIAKIVKIVSE